MRPDASQLSEPSLEAVRIATARMTPWGHEPWLQACSSFLLFQTFRRPLLCCCSSFSPLCARRLFQFHSSDFPWSQLSTERNFHVSRRACSTFQLAARALWLTPPAGCSAVRHCYRRGREMYPAPSSQTHTLLHVFCRRLSAFP